MSTERSKEMASRDILNIFISADKYWENLAQNLGMKYKKRTYFQAFKEEIDHFYDYTGNHSDFKMFYSLREFENLFYDAVCYDEELPEEVQEKFLLYFEVATHETPDNTTVLSAREEIINCILQEKLDEAVNDFWIKHNDRKTEKVREMIFRPHPECNSDTVIQPLITWAENHNRLNYDFIYRMFEYGYIMGKRAERHKRAGQD